MILSDHDGRVRTITFNRPDKLNAFDRHLYRVLIEALDDAATDESVSVVVLTGAGRAFSAGVDLTELHAADPQFGELGSRATTALAEFPKPLLFAVNGLAVGIGATALGYADVAIAARSARFRYPFTHMGVNPEIGSSWMLPHQIGWQNSQWLLLSSEWIDADRAQRMGLVLEVVDDVSLIARAHELAATIAQHSLPSLIATKRTYTAWRREPAARAQEVEYADFAKLLRGEL